MIKDLSIKKLIIYEGVPRNVSPYDPIGYISDDQVAQNHSDHTGNNHTPSGNVKYVDKVDEVDH